VARESGQQTRLSRREALAMAAVAGASAELLRTVGYADGAGSARRIMLIRHAEKPAPSGPPFGITAAGLRDSRSLIVDGWERAGALVELFDPLDGKLRRPGLVKPSRLFASDPGRTGSRRPLETITPLSQRMRMPVHTPVKDKDTAAIAQILSATPGSPLAAWPHQHIPAIAQSLGNVTPTPPAKWDPRRFDLVWVFTRRADGGWDFKQVPQLLLAGDKRSVIR
jgi:hypothetical protein